VSHKFTRTPTEVAVQVAVEAIVNDPQPYDLSTMEAVLEAGQAHNVAAFYVLPLATIVRNRRADEAGL
jgi:hypothetical protein